MAKKTSANPSAAQRASAAHCDKEPKSRERFSVISGYSGRPPLEVRGRVVILVDDGIATGTSMRAAATALRQKGAAKIVVAVPVGSPETCQEFEEEVDETICAIAPEWFQAVGQYYEDFSQTTDDEVRELLGAAAKEFKSSPFRKERPSRPE